jgi:hypothetical protein
MLCPLYPPIATLIANFGCPLWAEDALIAALKVKHNHPEALISYVRKSIGAAIVAILTGRNED